MGDPGRHAPKLVKDEDDEDPEVIALSRYLVFTAKGVTSDSYPCPDWYSLVAAAHYLHCKPWELLEQSIWWRDRAIIAMNAEASARKSLEGH